MAVLYQRPTGRPKGAVLTHRNLLMAALSYYADVDAVGPGDTILHAAPMSHGSGIYALPFIAQAANNLVPEVIPSIPPKSPNSCRVGRRSVSSLRRPW